MSKRATKAAASADGSKAAGSALDIVAARDAGYGYGPYEAYDAVQSRGVVGWIYPEAQWFSCPDLANVFVWG